MVLFLAPADLERERPAMVAAGFSVALVLSLRVSGAIAVLVGVVPEEDGREWRWREEGALGRQLRWAC